MKTAVIVDYGMGNLDSVARAVEQCGARARVSADPGELGEAACLILPGVGAFAAGMANIRERGLDRCLHELIAGKSMPLLGICLGMQLLARRGSEGGEADGLGLIDGEVHRLTAVVPGERIPHMGWNEVRLERESPLFSGIASGKDFYFVHSYHLVCSRSEDVVARTPYAGGFVSVVGRDNVWGTQFHPEKSQRAGFQLLSNFLHF